MNIGFGRHYSADLYLCQNDPWNTPEQFQKTIDRICPVGNDRTFSWQSPKVNPGLFRFTGAFDDILVLMQIVPDKSYLALDIISWQPQLDLQSFAESLIDLLAPQVIASESRLRGEHLLGAAELRF